MTDRKGELPKQFMPHSGAPLQFARALAVVSVREPPDEVISFSVGRPVLREQAGLVIDFTWPTICLTIIL